jgi:sigma-E factor negative regulatory protein RseA
MTDEHLPQLSALVDGELADRKALSLRDALDRDPALSTTWERYHLIGQVLRGERVSLDARGVAAAVRERLRSESAPPTAELAVARVRVWRPPFAGAALAAAAVLLAVFAVPGLYQGPESAPLARTPLAAAAPFALTADAREFDEVQQPRRWQTDREALASRLDLFLVNHQEATPVAGVNGMLPYATLVGYETGR